MCTVLYATTPFLLIHTDVPEKVGMAPIIFSHATATSLFQFHSRGNTANGFQDYASLKNKTAILK